MKDAGINWPYSKWVKSFLDHIEGQYESQQTTAVFKKPLTVSQMKLLFTYRIPKDPVTPGMSCKRKTLSTSKSGGLLLSTMFVLPFQTIPKALTIVLQPRRLVGLIFAGYVPLAPQNPNPIIVYSVAKCRPHLSNFRENVIFAIPT